MATQKDQEKQDLRKLIEEDKELIIAFLKTFNLKVKSQMLYQSARLYRARLKVCGKIKKNFRVKKSGIR